MSTSDPFAPRSPDDVARLLAESPLAWVVSLDPVSPAASLLPIRPRFSETGEVIALAGHFGGSNPQIEIARRSPRTLFLFLGANGYVSPSFGGDPTRAPTWNYASARFLADIELTRAPEAIDDLLADLVGAMEPPRPAPWRIADMGARYRQLSSRVVGFHARVLEARPRFKLGQDEPDRLFGNILDGLEAEGRGDLADWMRRLDVR